MDILGGGCRVAVTVRTLVPVKGPEPFRSSAETQDGVSKIEPASVDDYDDCLDEERESV
jgi:hypothetical protein